MTIHNPGGRTIEERDEEREKLYHIGFKADAETCEALEELERAMPGRRGACHGRRSQVIRRLILEARDRLREGKIKMTTTTCPAFVEFDSSASHRANEPFTLVARVSALFRGRWLEADDPDGIVVLDIVSAGKNGDYAQRHRGLDGSSVVLGLPLREYARGGRHLRTFDATPMGEEIRITLVSDRDIAGFRCRFNGFAVTEPAKPADVTSR